MQGLGERMEWGFGGAGPEMAMQKETEAAEHGKEGDRLEGYQPKPVKHLSEIQVLQTGKFGLFNGSLSFAETETKANETTADIEVMLSKTISFERCVAC
jgi:hypothetical protein